METPRKWLNKYWCSVRNPTICLISEIYKGRSFSFHDAERQPQIKKENKFNFKEAIVSALKSLIQIK
jgi:hypothetical protein